jgi:hypothetical protein
VYAFAVVALIGLYGMLAPLLHWWPWGIPAAQEVGKRATLSRGHTALRMPPAPPREVKSTATPRKAAIEKYKETLRREAEQRARIKQELKAEAMLSAQWINDRREVGNTMLAGWAQMRNMPNLCADAVRWERETYDELAEHAPTHQAHFRDENGLGPEWQRQRSGPHEYEDTQRVMLRRRLHRLAEIADRMQR